MEATDEQVITWNHELERLLAEEGEKALGSSWIHGQAESYYAKRNQWITIPCVILSTLSGAGSIGSQTMFSDGKTASLAIGAVSIGVGILQTLGGFWSFAKLQEAHRQADIAWHKLHRFISVEMTLPRQERIAAKDMLKICREQIERLSETSPLVPDTIITEFNARFGSKYKDVAIPDIANGLKKVAINSPPVGDTPKFLLGNRLSPKQNAITAESFDKTPHSVAVPSAGESSAPRLHTTEVAVVEVGAEINKES